MLKRHSFLLCLFAVALPCIGSTHIWSGANSQYFSNDSNWTNGSPAGDPNAELAFPAGSRLDAVNDLPSLVVRSLSISGTGYTVSGNAITLAPDAAMFFNSDGLNTISCNLVVPSVIAVDSVAYGGAFLSRGINFSGSISGAGGLRLVGAGEVILSGGAANTYTGPTEVMAGALIVTKSPGVVAIPGSLLLRARAYLQTNEQIHDASAITVGATATLEVTATETVGLLTIDGGGTVSVSGTLILNGDIRHGAPSTVARTTLQGPGTILLPATRTITVGSNSLPFAVRDVRGSTPAAGIIVNGDPSLSASFANHLEFNGSYTGVTEIRGGNVAIDNAQSAVRLVAGRLTGQAASLIAEGGEVNLRAYTGGLTATGNVQLGAAVNVVHDVAQGRVLSLNGQLDLGSAHLLLSGGPSSSTPGAVYTIINNDSTQPVTGTFAGLPEGAVLNDRWKISYVGGSGNDVTVTDVARLFSATSLTLPTPPSPTADQSFSVTATVSANDVTPTGVVVLKTGSTILATWPLVNGTASGTITLAHGTYPLTATYPGDERVKPSEATANLPVYAPTPTITDITPTTAEGGRATEFTIHGTNFLDGATVRFGSDSPLTTSLSPTELRATYTPPSSTTTYPLEVRVAQESPSIGASNALNVTITPPPPPTPTVMVFGTDSVTAPVTPGATTFWESWTFPYNNTSYNILNSAIIKDDDQDGSVKWLYPPPSPPLAGLFLAMDLSARAFLAADVATKSAPSPQPFPEKTFLRDASGHFTHVILPKASRDLIMWSRPGVGNWRYWPYEGIDDLDGTKNGLLMFDTSSMLPMSGSPAPPPAGVEPGDLFAAIRGDRSWFGDRVDDHLDDGDHSPGVVAMASASTSLRETDGQKKFAVIRRDGTDGEVRVHYTISVTSAVPGVHVTSQDSELVFGPGEIVKTIVVPILNDDAYEGNSAVTIKLTDSVGAPLVEPKMTSFTVEDDEQPPALSVSGSDVNEGSDGIHEVPFTIRLTGSTLVPASVQWSWESEPSSATTGQVTFAPGETVKTVVTTYEGNTLPQPDRYLSFSLRTPVNASIPTPGGNGSATIIDDDFSAVSIVDTSVNESRGMVSVRFSLSQPSLKQIDVHYKTMNDTATAGSDYTAVEGTLYSTNGTINVPILNDATGEIAERFLVTLTSVDNGVLGTHATAIVTIVDDDAGSAVPPASATATANGTANVTVNWSAVPNATSYQVFRGIGATPTLLASTAGTSLLDTNVVANTAYVYRVKAVVAGATSAYSVPDAATTLAFTDDPIVPGSTPIKATHIEQLRLAVNAMREAAGLSAQFFGATITSGMTISASPIQQLRTALNEARAAMGVGTLSFSDASLTPASTAVRATHLMELRTGCK